MTNKINEYIVYIDNISKSFIDGKIKANQNITLKIKENDIYALMGENGSGKSTLMSVLFGLYNQNAGKIFVRGKEVNFQSSQDAHKEKIGMVHQHFKLVEEFTIHENIILGNEMCNDELPIKNFIMDKKASANKINSLIKKYNLNLDINKKVKTLNVSEKQKVEILKLLFLDSDILIFDEPTAILSKLEITHFLEMLINFKKEGKTIILITHKLDEVFKVANRGAVLRKGKMIEEFDIKSMNTDKISLLMVGQKIDEVKNKSNKEYGDVVLSIKDLEIDEEKKISFDIRKGEIFSIAGISGNGQSQLISLITGMKKVNKGQILIRDSKGEMIDTTKMNINHKYKIGLGFVPEDRQKHGLFLNDSISYNTVINRFNEITKEGKSKFYKAIPFIPFIKFINWNGINKNTLSIINNFDVQGSSSIYDEAGWLSGGNQQKLIIGREMVKDCNLIILFQPTRGLDIGAIQIVHKSILKAAKENKKAILLVSYELSEIYSLSDTIAVINQNQILKQGDVKNMNIDIVGKLMTSLNSEVANEK